MVNSFAESIAEMYSGRQVEVNTGESRLLHKFYDFDEEVKEVICGTVKKALGDALVLECKVNNKIREITINCWSITSVVPLDNSVDKFSTKDFYMPDEISRKRKK